MADRMTRGSREYQETVQELMEDRPERGFNAVRRKKDDEPAYKSPEWYKRRERDFKQDMRDAPPRGK